MAHFKIGYQYAEECIAGNYFTMLMQYFPNRESVPKGKSIAHGTNQCAYISFLKGVNLFNIDTFDNTDLSDLYEYDVIGSLVISAQGCTNFSPGSSLYISGSNLPNEYNDYILTSTLATFKMCYMSCDVTEFFVGTPKHFLELARNIKLEVRDNSIITVKSIANYPCTPTKLSNLIYFN